MDPVLSAALQPILRDLRRDGLAEPRIEDRDWTGDPDRPSAMLWSPDGSGTGVSVDRHHPAFNRVADVADQVQQWAIEELWGHASTNWPRCPQHPGTHPMLATTAGETAVWACPFDQTVLSTIGDL